MDECPRIDMSLIVLRLVTAGGWHASTENTDKVECYDPKTNQWTMCAPMKERRYRPGVAVVDGKIYVLGGEEGWDRYGEENAHLVFHSVSTQHAVLPLRINVELTLCCIHAT